MRIAISQYYNHQVFTRQFFMGGGGMVWRMNEFAHQDKINKMSLKWEGSYIVVDIEHLHDYVLKGKQGKGLKNTFIVEHLKQNYA